MNSHSPRSQQTENSRTVLIAAHLPCPLQQFPAPAAVETEAHQLVMTGGLPLKPGRTRGLGGEGLGGVQQALAVVSL